MVDLPDNQIQLGQQLAPVVTKLEASGDNDVSPKGAVGKFQVTKIAAADHGFDYAKLSDPVYNEMAGKTILNGLYQRYQTMQSALRQVVVAVPFVLIIAILVKQKYIFYQ